MNKNLHPVVIELLTDIAVFRERSGMDRTTFGLKAMNDPSFISRLELGRNPRFVTIEKVREFIAKRTKAVRK
jgi:hypothetical protein